MKVLFCFSDSLRSREDERVSKPGAISTPVKIADDIPLSKTMEEVVVERNEKQTPPLPGIYAKMSSYVWYL